MNETSAKQIRCGFKCAVRRFTWPHPGRVSIDLPTNASSRCDMEYSPMHYIESMVGESRARHHRDPVAVVVVVRLNCVNSDTESIPFATLEHLCTSSVVRIRADQASIVVETGVMDCQRRFHSILCSCACSDARARPSFDEAFFPFAGWLRFRSSCTRTIRHGSFQHAAPRAGGRVQS